MVVYNGIDSSNANQIYSPRGLQQQIGSSNSQGDHHFQRASKFMMPMGEEASQDSTYDKYPILALSNFGDPERQVIEAGYN